MSNTRAVVQDNLTAEQARRVVLALLAMGLEAAADREEGFGWQVTVPEEAVETARPLVRDALLEAAEPPRPKPQPTLLASPDGGIWTLENTSSSLAIAALCVAVHLMVHGGAGPSPRSTMLDAGAAAPWLIRQGEWWRLATAVFLHFDAKHLVGNTSTLLFLGAPLVAQIGHLRMALLFVATGIAGNIVSQVFGNDAALKVGASGGVCGLLGALAGVTLAVMASAADARDRRPAWQTLGALVALFGMIVGFAPGRDHYAHVGGLLSGIAFGWLFAPPRRKSPSSQESST